jgi:hypothetical protein
MFYLFLKLLPPFAQENEQGQTWDQSRNKKISRRPVYKVDNNHRKLFG